MGYLSRTPTSNDPPSTQGNPWGGNELVDDVALLLNELGEKCAECKRVTHNQFLHNGLCPDCGEEPVDMPDIFKPEYLNLHDLAGYVKAHLGDLLKGSCSGRGMEWGKAWITELIHRLAEIKKEISRGSINTRLDWGLATALQKSAIESRFIVEQEWQLFPQGGPVIAKIRRSFQLFLKNPTRINKQSQRLKLFCEILCKKMPYEERFRPGPVAPEIPTIREKHCNYMADGQPGEAD